MNTKQAYATLKLALRHNGWEEDKFGHFHKTFREEKHRVKFQANSVRIEVRSRNGSFWIKSTGEYFGKMTIEHGAIRVGTRAFILPTGE